MTGHFYNEHFPQSLHKLPKEDVLSAADTLEKAFSDDVLNPVFLPMVESEDTIPTFSHPHNWNNLQVGKRQIIWLSEIK